MALVEEAHHTRRQRRNSLSFAPTMPGQMRRQSLTHKETLTENTTSSDLLAVQPENTQMRRRQFRRHSACMGTVLPQNPVYHSNSQHYQDSLHEENNDPLAQKRRKSMEFSPPLPQRLPSIELPTEEDVATYGYEDHRQPNVTSPKRRGKKDTKVATVIWEDNRIIKRRLSMEVAPALPTRQRSGELSPLRPRDNDGEDEGKKLKRRLSMELSPSKPLRKNSITRRHSIEGRAGLSAPNLWSDDGESSKSSQKERRQSNMKLEKTKTRQAKQQPRQEGGKQNPSREKSQQRSTKQSTGQKVQNQKKMPNGQNQSSRQQKEQQPERAQQERPQKEGQRKTGDIFLSNQFVVASAPSSRKKKETVSFFNGFSQASPKQGSKRLFLRPGEDVVRKDTKQTKNQSGEKASRRRMSMPATLPMRSEQDPPLMTKILETTTQSKLSSKEQRQVSQHSDKESKQSTVVTTHSNESDSASKYSYDQPLVNSHRPLRGGMNTSATSKSKDLTNSSHHKDSTASGGPEDITDLDDYHFSEEELMDYNTSDAMYVMGRPIPDTGSLLDPSVHSSSPSSTLPSALSSPLKLQRMFRKFTRRFSMPSKHGSS